MTKDSELVPVRRWQLDAILNVAGEKLEHDIRAYNGLVEALHGKRPTKRAEQ